MEIPLTRGQVAIIDVDDWHLIKDYKWCASWDPSKQGYYAVTTIKGRSVGMHRLIMNAQKGEVVDHINGHGLNNTRLNLRIVTNAQNTINRKIKSNNKSGVSGVFLDKKSKIWIAYINVEGKRLTLGRFKDFNEAALARKNAEEEYHGEYARKNDHIKEIYVPAGRDTSLRPFHILGYGDVYIVPLTKGYEAIIDTEDYDIISEKTWTYSSGYGVFSRNKKFIMMHNFIMNPPDGFEVDHINGNRSDNRHCNLRLATHQQNMLNRSANRNNKIGIKCISRRGNRWRVRINLGGKENFLGSYGSLEEAIAVRDAAFEEHHGDFARYD